MQTSIKALGFGSLTRTFGALSNILRFVPNLAALWRRTWTNHLSLFLYFFPNIQNKLNECVKQGLFSPRGGGSTRTALRVLLRQYYSLVCSLAKRAWMLTRLEGWLNRRPFRASGV